MRINTGYFLAAIALILSGCVSVQPTVMLTKIPVGSNAAKIGVAMGPLPKIDTEFPGAGCLLCIAAASLANSSLSSYAETLPTEDLKQLKEDLANLLRKKGANVVVIDQPIDIEALPDASDNKPGYATKDFRSLRQKYGIDKLVLADISGLGFIRTYSDYIPTSDPKGLLRGQGYMVDLRTNAYDWYQFVYVTKAADGAWDEPPKFPGLTNAYFQALELGKRQFINDIASATPVADDGKATSPTVALAPKKTETKSALQ